MIERYIKANINKLNYHLTMGFLETKGIVLTENEAMYVTKFLKENYQEIMRGNFQVFQSLKGNLRPEIFKKVTQVFIEMKNQYL